METRDQYVERLKQKIDEWNAQITEFDHKMKEASLDAQRQYAAALDEMKEQCAEAEKKMREVANTEREKWEQRRAQFETAWQDIADGFQQAWSRFK
ncbi:hypothetical protein H0I76_04645 [Limibaculum sp. M0105]|uniref:Uncharacterized protein n=1 Tax=Thermohalobaculum xanthum TaxID=2753746 RepID=A0A8J7M5Z5_9RHOB|nr:hypothetical protein [Thermohalobaculum xanthum]MBK0398467.1 hypothetical protein [Thermohalobaculum xanthum]